MLFRRNFISLTASPSVVNSAAAAQPSDLKLRTRRQVVDWLSLLVSDLAKKVMRGIALALSGPSDAFDGEITGESSWAMHLIGSSTLQIDP
ncbi:hypothetical protein M5K25_016597 [Dendrobium thyrsiflorum]|uniref:Uncharacterized protein n=1 Tax=Dendrobium thyrsiflorum TaxID=117978 RepID=A0ABD0UK53_DENTH